MKKICSVYILKTIRSVLQVLILAVSILFGSAFIVNTTLFAASNTPDTILVLGDSLSASFGLDSDKGWVALLQLKLSQQKYDYRIINASVSGDTTRNGLSRIQSSLQSRAPSVVIIALGGNDGLRGLPFSEIENNLQRIIQLGKAQGAKVLLAGVRLPPNYGLAYNKKFAEVYQRLSNNLNVPLVAKMLDRVADNSELMQADGIHPKAEAQPLVMENIWKGLKPLL